MPTSKPKPLTPLLFLLLATLAASQEFTYSGFAASADAKHPNLTFNGVTELRPDGILRLTNDTRRLIGHAFYPTPLRLLKNGAAVSFSTAVAFAIVPEYPKLGGHGLAFVAAPDPRLPGALPSQYLGLLSARDIGNATNHVFAVEFDTVQDFEFGDINDNHVGVDLNNLASNASAPAASGDAPVNLKSGDTIQAWVDYDGDRKLLNVSLSTTSTKPAVPLISFPVNLSTIFQEKMYVGFSASTGLLASSHYIMGWSFNMSGPAQSLDLSSLPSLPQPKGGKNSKTSLILALAFSAFVALVLLAATGAYVAYRIKNADVIEPWELDYGPHRFKYSELRRATRGFRDRELLGSGGFGKVYRGMLPGTHAEVAVKRVSHESRQGLREFVAEIASIGRLRHRNLVQLQGWCRRRGDLLLVYDYMPNGSLDKHLFGDHTKATRLIWSVRYKILRNVASALLYLHEEWEHIVLHRDVKASNVLLDADMGGRLGDFGLAKLYEHGANPSTTRVVGTLGYIAPELTRTGKATTSADVFAFGALVLEVVSGRRPIEPKAAPEELVLAEWAWERYAAGEVCAVVDPRLVGQFDACEAAAAVKVGLLCSHPAAVARPTMREVVRLLDGGDAAEVPEPPPPPPPPPALSGEVGFDDFLHSYPSSSFDKAAGPTSGVDSGLPSSVATFVYSPLSLRSSHVSV